ncbi:hypothetical protein Nmel_017456 [Mimus melanotis]
MNNYLGKELMDVWVLSVAELVGFVCSCEMPDELSLSQIAERILSPMGFGKPPKQSCSCLEKGKQERGELTLPLYIKLNKINPNKM